MHNKFYMFAKASSVEDIIKSTLSENNFSLNLTNIVSFDELLDKLVLESASMGLADYDLILELNAKQVDKLKVVNDRLILITSNYSTELSEYFNSIGIKFIANKPVMPSTLQRLIENIQKYLKENTEVSEKESTPEILEDKLNEAKNLGCLVSVSDEGGWETPLIVSDVENKLEDSSVIINHNIENTSNIGKEDDNRLSIRPPRFQYNNPIEKITEENERKEVLKVPVIDDIEQQKTEKTRDEELSTKEILGSAFKQLKNKFFS